MNSEDLSAARRRLAATLKQLRLDAQLSAQELGAEFGWSQSKVSKIENGRTVPSVPDVEQWLHRFRVGPGPAAEVADLARSVHTEARAWRQLNRHGHSTQQRAWGDREAEATSIACYQSEVVPGLLQTPEYARRVLEVHSTAAPDTVPATVRARLDRQTILFDESKTIECILTETALRWRPGTLALTLAQLDRIAMLATLPTVTIGVIPLQAQQLAKPLHSFVILRFPESTEVQVETLSAELAVTEPEDVALYEDFLADQRSHAVSGPELQHLLQRIAEDLRKTDRATE